MIRNQEIDKLIFAAKTKSSGVTSALVDGFKCSLCCTYFDGHPFFALWFSNPDEEWFEGTMDVRTSRDGYMRGKLEELRRGERHIKRCDSGSILLFKNYDYLTEKYI